MKNLFIGASLILSASAAQADNVEGQFAVLKPEKSCKIVVPEGESSSQVYFSKDCSTAYILPPLEMKMEVTEPVYLAGADDNLCKSIDEQSLINTQYASRIDALNKQIDKSILQMASASDSQKDSIKLQIVELRKQIASYQKT